MVNFDSMNQMIRSTGRMSKLMETEATRNDTDTAEIISSVVDDLVRMQEELKPLIESLDNSEERLVITLKYLKGYDLPFIAEKMGLSERTVYRLIRNAKLKLIDMFPDAVTMG